MNEEIKEILDYMKEYIKPFNHDSEPMLNSKDIKLLLDYITNLQQIEEEHKKLNGELRKEISELQKQKDDVVANAKEKIKRYESYINDLKNGNYPSPTVRQERQELIFRIREQKDILRMLGEIDEI